ncbi:MAG: transglutaminase family protein [Ilumatobacteraceae bacterium]
MGERWTDRGRELTLVADRLQHLTPDGEVDDTLFDVLLILGRVLDPEVDLAKAVATSDRLSERISSDPSPRGVVRSLMESGIGGAGPSFLSWRNSSVAHALLSGHGLPLTLGAITVVAAGRVGCQLELIGLPFHVVVGCPVGEGTSETAMLAVMSNRDVLVRVLNNLENAANAGRDLPLLGLVRVVRAVAYSVLSASGESEASGRSSPSGRHMLN